MVRCADKEPAVEVPPDVPGTGPTTMGRMTEAGMGGIPVAEDDAVDAETLVEEASVVVVVVVGRVWEAGGGGEKADNDSDVDADAVFAAGGACGVDRLGETLIGSVLTTGSTFTTGGI